jgi:hypothetical protein
MSVPSSTCSRVSVASQIRVGYAAVNARARQSPVRLLDDHRTHVVVYDGLAWLDVERSLTAPPGVLGVFSEMRPVSRASVGWYVIRMRVRDVVIMLARIAFSGRLTPDGCQNATCPR